MPAISQGLKALYRPVSRLSRRARKPKSTGHELLPQAQSKLCALPTELIEYIAAPLEFKDLCSLRLTCKKVSSETLHHFGSTHLATIQTNLSLTSLQSLEHLARDQRLSRYVRILLIRGSDDIGKGFVWERSSSGSLIFPHPCVQALQDIILKLDGCRSFWIQKHHEKEDLYELDCLTPSDALAIILHVITETSLSVEALTADLVPGGDGAIDTNRLHPATYQRPEFREAWVHLQKFALRQSLNSKNSDWALEMFLLGSNIRSLTLNLDFGMGGSFVERACLSERLPNLQELDISAMTQQNGSFITFLYRFSGSLRVLRLFYITLESTHPWKSLFILLKGQFPKLKTIDLCWVKEFLLVDKTRVLRRIAFPKLARTPLSEAVGGKIKVTTTKWWAGEKRAFGISYSGPEMGKALDVLVEGIEAI